MTAPSSSCTTRPGRSGISSDPFSARKQQALVVLLVQQLADTQFRRADRRGSERLWQEVAALEIDPDRVTALLYSGEDTDNREALRAQDDAWLLSRTRPRQLGWNLSRLHLGRPRRRADPAQPSLSGIGISTAAGSGAQAGTRWFTISPITTIAGEASSARRTSRARPPSSAITLR